MNRNDYSQEQSNRLLLQSFSNLNSPNIFTSKPIRQVMNRIYKSNMWAQNPLAPGFFAHWRAMNLSMQTLGQINLNKKNVNGWNSQAVGEEGGQWNVRGGDGAEENCETGEGDVWMQALKLEAKYSPIWFEWIWAWSPYCDWILYWGVSVGIDVWVDKIFLDQ